MDGADVIVYGMCAGMILVGVVVMRLSRRDRAMGAIAMVLGVIGLLAYLGAEEGAPPPEATPAATPSAIPADTVDGTPRDPLSSPIS